MGAFRFSDVYGLLGAMLVLVLVYLVLDRWQGAQTIAKTGFDGTNSLLQTLQGR